MKIIRNIPAGMKVLKDVIHYNKYKKPIDSAKASGDAEEERRLILEATSTFGPKIVEQFGCDLHVYGEENLPDEGPVVIMMNHQSYADIPIMFAVIRKFQFGFVAKQYLAKAPLLGDWMPRIRTVFIENDDPREAMKAINQGIEYINEGFSLAICPEGKRSKGPYVDSFMRGAIKLATKPGVPIIPVALNGTYHMFEETGVASPARVDVKIFPMIPTAGISRQEEKELITRLETMIREGVQELAELQGDVPAGSASDAAADSTRE